MNASFVLVKKHVITDICHLISGNCRWLASCGFDSEYKSWHRFWDQVPVGENLEQAAEVEKAAVACRNWQLLPAKEASLQGFWRACTHIHLGDNLSSPYQLDSSGPAETNRADPLCDRHPRRASMMVLHLLLCGVSAYWCGEWWNPPFCTPVFNNSRPSCAFF